MMTATPPAARVRGEGRNTSPPRSGTGAAAVGRRRLLLSVLGFPTREADF